MIYCVEDEDNIRELLVYTLESAQFKAQGFRNGADFKDALSKTLPELIMLDIMMPQEDGMSLLRFLRQQPNTKHIPVIMLTAKNSEFDKVKALDAGADDYITKPFGMMEMLARVKALLRRSSSTPSVEEILTFQSISMNLATHKVKVAGTTILLTLKEFSVLEKLLRNKGIVITREQLLNEIWGYSFDGETRTVDVHIRSLRHKLGAAGSFIQTVRGVGYSIGEAHD